MKTLLLSSFVALGIASCTAHTSAPSGVVKPRVLRRIDITADVPDSAVLCFYLTPVQSMQSPMTVQPLCRETVGALRYRYLLEQNVSQRSAQ